MSTRMAAWPTNVGAYRRSGFAAITASLIPLVAGADVTTVGAFIVAAAGDVGLLLAPPGAGPIRRHLKSALVWTATLAATALLALAQTEGSGGDLQLGQLWVQLDPTDVLIVGALVLKTVLQTVVPNAAAQFATVPGEVTAVHDVPEPPRLAEGGTAVDAEPVTGLMSALTPAHIAQLEAAAAASIGDGAPLVPVEQLHSPAAAVPAPRAAQPQPTAQADVDALVAELAGDPDDDGVDDAQTDDDGAPEHRAAPEPVHALAGLLSRRTSRTGTR